MTINKIVHLYGHLNSFHCYCIHRRSRVGCGDVMVVRRWGGGRVYMRATGDSDEWAATVVNALISLSSPNSVRQSGCGPSPYWSNTACCVHSPVAHSMYICCEQRLGHLFLWGPASPEWKQCWHMQWNVFCFLFLLVSIKWSSGCCCAVCFQCSFAANPSFAKGSVSATKKGQEKRWVCLSLGGESSEPGSNQVFSHFTGLFVLIAVWSGFHGVTIVHS